MKNVHCGIYFSRSGNGNINFEIHRNDKYQIGLVNQIGIVNINRIAITTNDFAN